MTTPTRESVWTRYWRSGILHSCHDSFDGGAFGPETAGFWHRASEPLTASDHLLEVGCGNGALVQLLVRHLPFERLPQITAIDLARIAPPWLAQQPAQVQARLHFHGNASVEKLPFADGHFSGVLAQFALEYAQPQPAWAELARVLRPGALAALIVHHRDSHICAQARDELAHCNWLLNEAAVHSRAARLAPFLADAGSGRARRQLNQSAEALQCRADFNAAMQALAEREDAGGNAAILTDTALALMRCLSQASALPLADTRTALAALHQQLQDAQLRLVELLDCALNDTALADWRRHAETQGFTDFTARLHHERESLFGWAITARRAA